jgi:hypothetical protein
MQHVPEDSTDPVAHLVHHRGAHGLGACIACHTRTAYNLLVGVLEILRPFEIWRRHGCKDAGACACTGLCLGAMSCPTQTPASALWRRHS